MGGMGVSTTITTHIDDLEYGSCEGDAERWAAVRSGYGVSRTQARIYVGDDEEEEKEDKKPAAEARTRTVEGSKGEDVQVIEEDPMGEKDAVIIETEVSSSSSSSSSSSPMVPGVEDEYGRERK